MKTKMGELVRLLGGARDTGGIATLVKRTLVS